MNLGWDDEVCSPFLVCPLGKVSRANAASSFYSMLFLESRDVVETRQGDAFTDVDIALISKVNGHRVNIFVEAHLSVGL